MFCNCNLKCNCYIYCNFNLILVQIDDFILFSTQCLLLRNKLLMTYDL